MKYFAALVISAFTITGCNNASETASTLNESKTATLDYANCLNDEANLLADNDDPSEHLVEQTLEACSDLRSKALAQNAVPIMAESEAEFDKIHTGLARGVINTHREKDTNAKNR